LNQGNEPFYPPDKIINLKMGDFKKEGIPCFPLFEKGRAIPSYLRLKG
jgi:hypothetical protein